MQSLSLPTTLLHPSLILQRYPILSSQSSSTQLVLVVVPSHAALSPLSASSRVHVHLYPLTHSLQASLLSLSNPLLSLVTMLRPSYLPLRPHHLKVASQRSFSRSGAQHTTSHCLTSSLSPVFCPLLCSLRSLHQTRPIRVASSSSHRLSSSSLPSCGLPSSSSLLVRFFPAPPDPLIRDPSTIIR
jgi:hypothetical protein